LVRQNRWSGILVEPQPEIFQRLKQSYAGFSRLAFEQAAIVEEGTSLPLYGLKGEYAHRSMRITELCPPSGIDFEQIAPRIIHFEHAHLRAIEKAECVDFLIAKDYKLVISAYDATAFQSKWMYD
jgi:hypothetical protein